MKPLDLRETDSPPVIIIPLVQGNTFSREFTLTQKGFDYTGTIISFQVRESLSLTGTLVYEDLSVNVDNVVVPTGNEVGSCTFTITIPKETTADFTAKNTLYTDILATYTNDTAETLCYLQIECKERTTGVTA